MQLSIEKRSKKRFAMTSNRKILKNNLKTILFGFSIENQQKDIIKQFCDDFQ